MAQLARDDCSQKSLTSFQVDRSAKPVSVAVSAHFDVLHQRHGSGQHLLLYVPSARSTDGPSCFTRGSAARPLVMPPELRLCGSPHTQTRVLCPPFRDMAEIPPVMPHPAEILEKSCVDFSTYYVSIKTGEERSQGSRRLTWQQTARSGSNCSLRISCSCSASVSTAVLASIKLRVDRQVNPAPN